MAYDPADLRLPSGLLRLLDVLVRLRISVSSAWKIGMTRPGVLLLAVLVGVWLAAFYSGNNLLYLCGTMLTALAIASVWQAVRLLKSIPCLAVNFPEYTQAEEAFVLRKVLPVVSPSIGLVDVIWHADVVDVQLQLRLDKSALLTGRLLAGQRGVFKLRKQTLATSAPLGLWQLSYTRDEALDWVVLPKPVLWQALMSGNVAERQVFEGDELRDLRGYMPGDPISRIHWRKAASDSARWSVKRFEAHENEIETMKLRIDLRVPGSVDAIAGAKSFEYLLSQAWYWVEGHLKKDTSAVEVVLGHQQFEFSRPEQKQACIKALAMATPQQTAPVGQGGVLLSLVND